MPKKVNESITSLPKSEAICLHFNNDNQKYIVTRDSKDNTYYLYEKTDKGMTFKKSRKKDPCFPECYWRRCTMNRETLKKILQEKTMSFTGSEISTMIDEELEKPPEQMDTDFINYCLDVLEI